MSQEEIDIFKTIMSLFDGEVVGVKEYADREDPYVSSSRIPSQSVIR